MKTHRDRAVVLLVNYFEAIAKKAGMTWDADYTAEISEAVDEIVSAAILEVRDQHLVEMDQRLIEVTRRLDKHERQLRGIQDQHDHEGNR